MKRLFCCVFFLLPFLIYAHELTITGGVDNYAFSPTAEGPEPALDTLSYIPNADFSLAGSFSQNITYHFGASLNTMYRYAVQGEAIFRASYFDIGIGTFFEFSDNGKQYFYPGLIGYIGIDVPEAFFLNGRIIVNLYNYKETVGNIAFDLIEANLGYWAPNTKIGAAVQRKIFQERRLEELYVKETLLRYYLHILIFQKNMPFTITVDGGYQVLTADYTELPAVPGVDGKKSLAITTYFGGMEWTINLGSFKLILGGEIPFAMEAPWSQLFFFKAWAGFSVNIAAD
jgi:hypothetical protein